MARIEVGQKLWCVVDFRHGRNIKPPQQSEVTVVKAGRKFAILDSGDRIFIESLVIDGGDYSSPGKCFLSKEAYELSEGAADAWKEMKQKMAGFKPPAGVTIADIEAACALLKIN